MSYIEYKGPELYIENVAYKQIAAEFGTPCYVYSKQAILQNWHGFYDAFKQSHKPFKINYAVKANSNLSILRLLAKQGSGFDVVSGGEIDRVLAAGGKAKDIVFSGVGKSSDEINYALDLDICSIHIESEAELFRINELAGKKNKVANIAFRINPNVTGNSHPYNTTGSKDNKFGIDYAKAVAVYLEAKELPNVQIKGIASHIGSQITELEPFVSAIEQLITVIQHLTANDIKLEYIDIGGGLGIRYNDETPPTKQEYVTAVLKALNKLDLEIHIEPGRSIVADAGTLLTRVEYLKSNDHNNFAIVDCGMNDLIRPALYDSYHEILPVESTSPATEKSYAVVGPICESGDFIAMQPKRNLKLSAGDLLVVKDCGAYGFSMSSNYNTRPRCAEVLVDGDKVQLIRKRETVAQLLENENI